MIAGSSFQNLLEEVVTPVMCEELTRMERRLKEGASKENI